MRCAKCKNRILQRSGAETRLRIQGPVRFDESGIAIAKCHWCKQDIAVPIFLAPLDEEIATEKFFIPYA